MGALLNIKRVEGDRVGGLRAYWIESTAPLTVDATAEPSHAAASEAASGDLALVELPADAAVAEIAAYLNGQPAPEIVVSVHGFNNPLQSVLDQFRKAFEFVLKEERIKNRPGLVCVGYRWPSEKILQPAGNVFRAAPGFLLGITALAALAWILNAALLPLAASLSPWARFAIYVFGLTLFAALFALPFALLLLRVAVYFRDNYRAAQYGVPDLVEFIRHLDRALDTPAQSRVRQAGVKLSFIGHSMGAFVVTSLVRVLSDVFDQRNIAASLDAGNPDSDLSSDIGHAFCLSRLVLVSPDIPAEHLLSRRANFLAPSLRRFDECYLFSNEGDVVLRLISTLANYFSFPTSHREHGFRLGNAEIVDPDAPTRQVPPAGIVNRQALGEPTEEFLRRLRVGSLQLDRLDAVLRQRSDARQQSAQAAGAPARLAERFTYFDCTDYVENERGCLTRAKHLPQLGWTNQLSLLAGYLLRSRPDVHSGYFDGPLTARLIYRLACLGLGETLTSFSTPPGHALDGLDRECRCKGIQVLLSPYLYRKGEIP